MSYVVTLSGSPSSTSRSTYLLALAENILVDRDIQCHRIDIRTLSADALIRGDATHLDIVQAVAAFALADAVIVTTPLYKSAYSGLLKVFLDLLPRGALSGKPILPMATGGSIAHLLALDYALRPVLCSLGAEHIIGNVYATEQDIPQLNGQFMVNVAIQQRITTAIAALMQAIVAPSPMAA